jgi:Tol biopolymer transport system component
VILKFVKRSAAGISRQVVVAAAVCAMIAFIPGVAGAAFPGTNGSIVFQSTRLSTAAPCPNHTSSELFSTPPNVTDPSQQPQLDCTGSTDQHAFFSPDGTEVIFASNRAAGGTSHFQLYTMPFSTDGTASGTPVDVSQNFVSTDSDDYPSWAPASPGNQNTIIFQRTLAGGQPELYTENINTPNSVAPLFSTTSGFSDSEPVYDPSNANEIAFVRTTSPTGPTQIYTYNFATQVLVNLSAANGDSTSNDSKPDFAPSPDGGTQLLVFQSDRTTANASNGPCSGTQLYTMSDHAPASGTTIAPVFQTFSGGSPTGVQVCPTEDGISVALENPVYSPDGTQIAFDQFNQSQDIYTTYDDSVSNTAAGADPARMSGEVDLTPNFATDEAPTWGPVSPGASTPEAPNPLVLPIAAGGIIGGTFLVVRRRRHRTLSST